MQTFINVRATKFFFPSYMQTAAAVLSFDTLTEAARRQLSSTSLLRSSDFAIKHSGKLLCIQECARCRVIFKSHLWHWEKRTDSDGGRRRRREVGARSEAVRDMKNSPTTFMLRIDRHFEGILSKINFGDVDPLTVDVVLVDVITTHGDTFSARKDGAQKAEERKTS